MKPHSELAAEPRFMIEHAATMLHLLRPNPEIDHALVIKMARFVIFYFDLYFIYIQIFYKIITNNEETSLISIVNFST